MAAITKPSTYAAKAGNGLGPTTYIFQVTVSTTTVAEAIALAENTYGLTVVGLTGTTGTPYMACQGANTDGTNGLENDSGVALIATFEDNLGPAS